MAFPTSSWVAASNRALLLFSIGRHPAADHRPVPTLKNTMPPTKLYTARLSS